MQREHNCLILDDKSYQECSKDSSLVNQFPAIHHHFICNIAIMHLILISALNLIGFLICGHIINFLLNWNLILEILRFGLGKGFLVLVPETYYLSQSIK